MLLKGDVTIHAPRKKVWDFLTDPNQIGQCVPGVEKIETIEELKKYRGVVSVGLGSVKARFSGDVEILELDEPNRAKLKAHGTATGSAADAVSEMSLSDGPDNSTLVALDGRYQCLRTTGKPRLAFDGTGLAKTCRRIL